jgi:acetolactate synthase-1/2/3 large subunit
MNGGDALVATLLAHDVDTAFCVPGESYLAVLEALRCARARLRLITNRHEAGVAFAADAYGKLTRKPGIAFVTRGPGASNAAIGVHTAAQDSSPMVLFVGQVPTHEKGLESFQEIDYRLMYGSIAKAVIEPTSAAEVADATARALDLATDGRPGPVIVPLPEDVTEGDAGDVAIAGPAPRVASAPPAEALAAAAEVISAARRPIVVSGELVALEAGHAALAEFADATGAGVVTAFRRQDTFANDDGAYFGHFGIGRAPFQREAWRECDVAIVAGSRLDAITTEGYTLLRDDQKLIQVHVDAGVIGRTRAPDVAIVAEVGPALAALTGMLPPPPNERLAWRDEVNQAYREFCRDGPAALGAVDMAAVVRAVAARLAESDHVIANDAGNFAGWVHRYYPYTRPYSQVGVASGAMGCAVPGAIAAKLVRPDAAVVAFVGDGGFMMTGQELATAVKEELAIKVIVCDNGAFGTILMHQHRFAGPSGYHGVELANPDFAALGRAFGVPAWKVEKTADFAPAFDAALAHEGPALIHLKTDIRDISAYGPLAGT